MSSRPPADPSRDVPDPRSGAGERADRPSLRRIIEAADDASRDALIRAAGGGIALLELGDEAERLAARSVQDAIDGSAVLVASADRIGGRREQARVRRASAHALAYAGRLEESLRMCDEAIARAANDHPIEAARARLATMQPLCLLGRLVEAVAAGERARLELLSADEPALAARADLNLANVARRRGDARAALEHLDRASPLLSDDPAGLGHVENARGEALLLVDDFANAERSFLAAAELYRPLDASFLLAVIEGNLAEVLARQGHLREAMASYESARRRFEACGAARHAAYMQIGQAEAMETLGLPSESLAEFDAASAAFERSGERLEAARAALGRARALLRLGRLADATAALRGADDVFRHYENDLRGATAQLLLGEISIASGDLLAASVHLEAALRRGRSSPWLVAAAENHLALLGIRAERLDEAEERLERALRIAEPLAIPTLLAELFQSRGMLRRRRGDASGAVADARRAIEQIERIRGSLHAERLRASFLGDRVAVYQLLVATLLDQGGPGAVEAAFAVAEQAKSRTLLEVARGALDLAVSSLGSARDPAEASLLQEIRRLHGELNALYSRIGGDAQEDQRRLGDGGWAATLREREARVALLEARVAATDAGRSADALSTALAEDLSAQVSTLLSPDTVFVEFFVAEGELMAWVFRGPASPRGSPPSVELLRNLAQAPRLAEAVGRLQFQIARALRRKAMKLGPDGESRLVAEFQAAAAALYDLTLRPVVDELRAENVVRRLVVAPHGVLHRVPWSALHDGDRWLLERFEIAVAPSAAYWAWVESRPRPAPTGPPLVVGVSDDAAPRIADEVLAVASILGGSEALLGPAATVDAVISALPSARKVHIACHGRFSAIAPASSGLRLHDRWLTSRELRSLRIDAELVTLSGCDTGRSLVADGDELFGLLRGFLQAGAASILVSLWATSDASTAELMRDLYTRLQRGLGVGAALREAQLAMRERREHPIHWAPFIVVGRS